MKPVGAFVCSDPVGSNDISYVSEHLLDLLDAIIGENFVHVPESFDDTITYHRHFQSQI